MTHFVPRAPLTAEGDAGAAPRAPLALSSPRSPRHARRAAWVLLAVVSAALWTLPLRAQPLPAQPLAQPSSGALSPLSPSEPQVGLRFRPLDCGALVDQETGLEWHILKRDVSKSAHKGAVARGEKRCGRGWRLPTRDELGAEVVGALGLTGPAWLAGGALSAQAGGRAPRAAAVGVRSFRKTPALRALRKLLDQGRLLTQQGRYEEGRARYREALRYDRESPVVLNELAYNHLLDKSLAPPALREGISICERSRELSWGGKPVRLTLYTCGGLYVALGEHAKALALYREALALGGSDRAARKVKELEALLAPPAPPTTPAPAAPAAPAAPLTASRAPHSSSAVPAPPPAPHNPAVSIGLALVGLLAAWGLWSWRNDQRAEELVRRPQRYASGRAELSLAQLFWDLGADEGALAHLDRLGLLAWEESKTLHEEIAAAGSYDEWLKLMGALSALPPEALSALAARPHAGAHADARHLLGASVLGALSFEVIKEAVSDYREMSSEEAGAPGQALRREAGAQVLETLPLVSALYHNRAHAMSLMKSFRSYEGLALNQRLFRTAEEFAVELASRKAQVALAGSLGGLMKDHIKIDIDGDGVIDKWEEAAVAVVIGFVALLLTGALFKIIKNMIFLRALNARLKTFHASCAQLDAALTGQYHFSLQELLSAPERFWEERARASHAALASCDALRGQGLSPQERKRLRLVLRGLLLVAPPQLRALAEAPRRSRESLERYTGTLRKKQGAAQAGQHVFLQLGVLLNEIAPLRPLLSRMGEEFAEVNREAAIAKRKGWL